MRYIARRQLSNHLRTVCGAAAAVAVALALAACQETSAPAPPVQLLGTYVLDSIYSGVSHRPPVAVFSTPSSGTHFIVADTLVLRADSSFTDTRYDSTYVENFDYTGPQLVAHPYSSVDTVALHGIWSATGANVTLQYSRDGAPGLFAEGASFTGQVTGAGQFTQTRPAQIGTEVYAWSRR